LPRLLLVRHGITELNSTRRFAGHIDVDLSAEGLRQVEKLRDRLDEVKIDTAYCSDLKRALVTAEIISSGHDIKITNCSDLREMNYGEAEGLTLEEIRHRYPKTAEAVADPSLELGFPGGENFKEFIARTVNFLDRLNKHTVEQTILIVTHSGPLRVLVCNLLGIDESNWRQFRCDNASLSIIETYPKRAILSLLNDTSHLKKAI
jgi:broad specificity phosphatase PhoE